MNSYIRFFAMVFTATIVMYCLMYLNTYALAHLWFSETRAYMTVIMGASMTVIMLLFMWGMHKNRALNVAIIAVAIIGFTLALWLVRSQKTVDDVSYMKAMIPHHSIAILTSERAQISDKRVRDLADQIIDTQRKEIAKMEALIADLQAR